MINVEIKLRKSFKKDVDRAKKRGQNTKKIQELLDLLILGLKNKEFKNKDDTFYYRSECAFLPEKYRPHKLVNQYNNSWSCDLAPDWRLIFSITENEIILERVGRHTDIFGKLKR